MTMQSKLHRNGSTNAILLDIHYSKIQYNIAQFYIILSNCYG